MGKNKTIIICAIVLVLLAVLSYIFVKPFLTDYETETGPYRKYVSERKDIFGKIEPVKEIREDTGEYAARFELTEAEWNVIKNKFPEICHEGNLWPDGKWVDGAIFCEAAFGKLFREDEYQYLSDAYSDGKTIRILGKPRSCDYEIIVLKNERKLSVFFFYKVYMEDTL
ncbi:MAG: hypothetical protein J6113_04855 [Lachnospiraceae bacterium]|nr:hypothetical protein [Lachnospiraceae bacterium]